MNQIEKKQTNSWKIQPHVHYPATLYYDGQCPLCLAEVEWLLKKDTKKNIVPIDIKLPEFKPPKNLTLDELDKVIHMQLKDGKIVTGIDAMYGVYAAVGLGWIVTPMRWRAMRYISDRAYLYFAKNRQGISKKFALFLGKKPCDKDGVCKIPPKK